RASATTTSVRRKLWARGLAFLRIRPGKALTTFVTTWLTASLLAPKVQLRPVRAGTPKTKRYVVSTRYTLFTPSSNPCWFRLDVLTSCCRLNRYVRERKLTWAARRLKTPLMLRVCLLTTSSSRMQILCSRHFCRSTYHVSFSRCSWRPRLLSPQLVELQ